MTKLAIGIVALVLLGGCGGVVRDDSPPLEPVHDYAVAICARSARCGWGTGEGCVASTESSLDGMSLDAACLEKWSLAFGAPCDGFVAPTCEPMQGKGGR